MHFLGAYTYLGSQAKLTAVSECCGYVHIYACCIGVLLEQTRFFGILCYYALAVMRCVLAYMKYSLIKLVYSLD